MNRTAPVPTYNSTTWIPTYSDQTFTGVDIDAWAQAFLLAMDEVLSPAIAVAIAALNETSYSGLMEAKSQLAQALGKSVVPVFPSVQGGDLRKAQDQFEQSVLSSLSTAYAVSSIVQVQADVAVAGTAEPGTATPRFFGSIGLRNSVQEQAREYTISGAKLPIQATTEQSPGFLTFLVTVLQPERTTGLSLDLQYKARFVEHLLDSSESSFGYIPSEWLRFVLDLPKDPLTMPLGMVNAPVPIRAFPASPVLQFQRAEQVSASRVAVGTDPLLGWNYTTNLGLTEQKAQDELWMNATYNLPLQGSRTKALRQAASPGTIEAVFDALASFTTAWAVLRPYVLSLPNPSSAGGGPSPAQVVAALLDQVQKVSSNWGRCAASRTVPESSCTPRRSRSRHPR